MDADIFWKIMGVIATVALAALAHVHKRISDTTTHLTTADTEARKAENTARKDLWDAHWKLDGKVNEFKDRVLSTMVTKDDLQSLHLQQKEDMAAMESRIMKALKEKNHER